MATMNGATVDQKPAAYRWRGVLLTAFGAVAVQLLFFDGIGMFDGGGISSFTEALQQAKRHQASIDVDTSSLRAAFMAIAAGITATAAIALRADIGKRWHTGLLILLTTFGGYALDASQGHRLIEREMARHGYNRCAIADREQGHGKSKIWFENYVSTPASCQQR
ncbi:hypothetical protein [Sphingomonas sp. TDK1]|uniref:hypothetical protein n=1 Tax=Sphingomonas sp. TDK1 TaxID=453247 RepID=UPI0007D9FFFF|nr:hypothetical protein [Sphingomonas sp. TDK1]OAN58829.1 hypothetical protein A7X12_04060 [Sphingomonas sp. TDK1]